LLCVILPKDDKAASDAAVWWEYTSYQGPARILQVPAREHVTAFMKAARAVLYFGHGAPDAWISHDGSVRFADAHNIDSAEGALVVAIACFSGKQLADVAIHRGARSYIGFTQKVAIIIASEQFILAGAAAVLTLLQGGTAQAFLDEFRDRFNGIVEFYRAGDGRTWPNCTLHWVAASRNANCIVLRGDPLATLN
jgi:Peptidase family C25